MRSILFRQQVRSNSFSTPAHRRARVPLASRPVYNCRYASALSHAPQDAMTPQLHRSLRVRRILQQIVQLVLLDPEPSFRPDGRVVAQDAVQGHHIPCQMCDARTHWMHGVSSVMLCAANQVLTSISDQVRSHFGVWLKFAAQVRNHVGVWLKFAAQIRNHFGVWLKFAA